MAGFLYILFYYVGMIVVITLLLFLIVVALASYILGENFFGLIWTMAVEKNEEKELWEDYIEKLGLLESAGLAPRLSLIKKFTAFETDCEYAPEGQPFPLPSISKKQKFSKQDDDSLRRAKVGQAVKQRVLALAETDVPIDKRKAVNAVRRLYTLIEEEQPEHIHFLEQGYDFPLLKNLTEEQIDEEMLYYAFGEEWDFNSELLFQGKNYKKSKGKKADPNMEGIEYCCAPEFAWLQEQKYLRLGVSKLLECRYRTNFDTHMCSYYFSGNHIGQGEDLNLLTMFLFAEGMGQDFTPPERAIVRCLEEVLQEAGMVICFEDWALVLGRVEDYHCDGRGLLHNTGGPALVLTDGSTLYAHHNKLHRDKGPAIELPNGLFRYHKNDKLHNPNGAARNDLDGGLHYYLKGDPVPEKMIKMPDKISIEDVVKEQDYSVQEAMIALINPADITKEMFENYHDINVRSMLVKQKGIDAFLKLFEAEIIAEDKVGTLLQVVFEKQSDQSGWRENFHKIVILSLNQPLRNIKGGKVYQHLVMPDLTVPSRAQTWLLDYLQSEEEGLPITIDF